MRYSTPLVLAAATAVAAQRPANMSVCDYYTMALFKDESAAHQYGLVEAVVNRAVIGNTTANPNLTGIVAPAAYYMGQFVNLLQYFDGQLNSTNQGKGMGMSVNFLDGGGAAPIMAGMPANDTTSNQYTLLTHLYQYFGSALGCSTYGSSGYPAYAGSPSMFAVHEYMGLDQYEVGYFIAQVGLSALSFGVTMDEVPAIGMELSSLFNVRCAPNTTVIMAQGPNQNSICIESSCPLAVNATCSSYPSNIPMPMNISMSSSGGSPSSSGSASGTGSMPAQQTTNAGSTLAVGSLLAAVAFLFAL